ncbi:MAG: hypothetical protein PHT39_08095 [Sphaerochaetaceae bacterium]|nr:hypothetical protein [Candidatus Cloacimonadota bacterium]MDD2232582.1 hypothetical protein [Sphaerochaetaceae bacterium]MDD4397516.1 hypothetical protein [Sphaerochaetaceae bacterium]
MKKTLCLLLCLILSLTALSAYSNQQKIYETTSEAYKTIKYLYLATGHALPSTTGPWSGNELSLMLEKIDRSTLGPALQANFDFAEKELDPDPSIKTDAIDMAFSGSLNIEGYLHTNTDGIAITTKAGTVEKAFQGRDQWIYNSSSQKPFVNLAWETWPLEHFYSYFELSLQNSRHAKTELGATALSSNLFMFQNMSLDGTLMDASYPRRAFVAIGGNHWTAQIGRDRLSWGAGQTGNLVISDNIPYHDMVRFTTYSNSFKYTFLTSFFPYPGNYYTSDDKATGAWQPVQKYGPLSGLFMYIAHRFEGRLFSDKLNLVLTEGFVYMSKNNTIDFRALNPVNFNHNNYTQYNSNSTLALELDWTPMKHLNVYGQIMLDEFAIPGLEGKPSAEHEDYPEALGYLAGLQTAFPAGNGIIHASLEGAFTTPFLYLRYGTSASNDKSRTGDDDLTPYGLQYVVAIREWSSSLGQTYYDEYFLGYTYGCDAIIGNLNAGFSLSDRISIDANLFFMAHGTHDKWTVWDEVGGTQESYESTQAPTDSHDPLKNNKYDESSKNSVEYTAVIGANISYEFSKAFDAFVQADYIIKKNCNNQSGVNENDFQLAFGASWNF